MRSMLPIQLFGQTSSTITPAASGDFVRAYMWRSSHGVPLRVGAAVVTFERLYSLFLLAAVSVLLILLPRHGVIGWIGVAVGLVLATIAPLMLEMTPKTFERWILGIPSDQCIPQQMISCSFAMRSILVRPSSMFDCTGWRTLSW